MRDYRLRTVKVPVPHNVRCRAVRELRCRSGLLLRQGEWSLGVREVEHFTQPFNDRLKVDSARLNQRCQRAKQRRLSAPALSVCPRIPHRL